MTAPLADREARREAAETLDRSFFVEAGAGTGKTALIARRVVNLLVSGAARVPEIAVITFTEKAAAELGERIRGDIARRLEPPAVEPGGDPPEPEDPRTRERIERAREDLDRAPFQTIHSFAASLLRLRPVEARVDPRFAVADAETTRALREEVWEEYLAAEAGSGSPRLRTILEAGVGIDSLESIAISFVENRDVARAGAPPPVPRPDLGEHLGRLEGWIAEQAAFARAHCLRTDDTLYQRIECAARETALLREGSEEAARRRLLRRKPATSIPKRLGNETRWDETASLERARESAGAWPEAYSAYARAYGAWIAGEAAGWLLGFVRACDERKRRRGLLDFGDLLLAARDLLARRGVAEDLSRIFRVLLVDEFQDTDPLQVEIVQLLAGSRSEDAPARLFLVGDPKQSIYRFRRADSRVYREARSWLSRTDPQARRTDIVTNFRCRPGIVAWVNEVFREPILAEYVPLVADRAAPAGKSVVYLVPGPDGSGPGREVESARGAPAGAPAKPRNEAGVDQVDRAPSALALSAREARVVEARVIARALRSGVEGASWLIEEGPAREIRPARYDDIAILFSTLGEAAIYEGALEDEGLPFQTQARRRFFTRPEIAWFSALLTAVETPHDEIAVVAALRSPLFGYGDDEILESRLARGRLDPLDPEPECAAAPALEWLAGWHRRRNERTVGETVQSLLERSGAVLHAMLDPGRRAGGGSPGRSRAARNLERLALIARRHEQEGGTFRSFARWLARATAERLEEPEASVPDDGDAGVRLMTIHSAKGLEFPVVVLADLQRRSQKGESVLIDRRFTGSDPTIGGAEARIEFKLEGPGGLRLASAGFEQAQETESEEQERERRRLLYVAATRARDFLMLPFPDLARKEGFLRLLDEAGVVPDGEGGLPASIVDWVELVRIGTEDGLGPPAPARSSGTPAARRTEGQSPPWDPEAWAREREALVGATQRRLRHLAASRSPTEEPRGDAAAPAAGRGGLESGPEAGGGTRRARLRAGDPADRARAIGLAVHAVLERIDLSHPHALDRLARTEAAIRGLRNGASEIATLTRRALGLPSLVRTRDLRRHREVPVSFVEDDTLVEGQIDLVVEEGDGTLTVLDFKTDEVHGEGEAVSRAQAYRRQLALYAVGLGRATGRRVGRTVILFLRGGIEVEGPRGEEAEALARETVRETGRA